MEKLLHERLRDRVNENPIDILNVLGRDFNCVGTGWVGIVKAIADEIERYYIPRPRFEDGEPVQFGDEFEDYGGNLHTLHELVFRDDLARGTGAPCLLKSVRGCNGIYDDVSFNLFDYKYVKRPQPKVLDADGVEINVGDTVYEVKSGHESRVTSTTMIDGEGNTICCIDACPGCLHYKPEELTHKEPDSIEKVNTDSMLNSYEYCKLILRNGTEIKRENESKSERKVRMRKAKMDDLLKRHRALIERGA